MALRKFKIPSLKEIEARALENSIIDFCLICKKEKAINIHRKEKFCDECLELKWNREQASKIAEEEKVRIISQRIPEMYHSCDVKKMEIKGDEFKLLCENGRSIVISGEVGTAKTNLACQILISRKQGQYFTVAEVVSSKTDIDKIKGMDFMVIDDVTKFDIKDQKKMEKLFDLLNYRYSECKDTIVTIDRTFEEVEKLFGNFGSALISRFRQWMLPVTLKTKWR